MPQAKILPLRTGQALPTPEMRFETFPTWNGSFHPEIVLA